MKTRRTVADAHHTACSCCDCVPPSADPPGVFRYATTQPTRDHFSLYGHRYGEAGSANAKTMDDHRILEQMYGARTTGRWSYEVPAGWRDATEDA